MIPRCYRRSYPRHFQPFEQEAVRFQRKFLLAVDDMADSHRRNTGTISGVQFRQHVMSQIERSLANRFRCRAQPGEHQ
jgi:hypothetical protein